MRTFAICLLYNKPEVNKASIRQFFNTLDTRLFYPRLVLVDNHYPEVSEVEKASLRSFSEEYGAMWLDPGKNLGLHGGFNFALGHLKIKKSDIIIGYDGDSYPVTKGWNGALGTVLTFGGDVAWASLWNKHTAREISERGGTPRKINQLDVVELKMPCLNSICAWTGEFLLGSGGLSEPNSHYGGLECWMWPHLNSKKQKWVFIKGYEEIEHPMKCDQDPRYQEWKIRHAVKRDFSGSFEEYIGATSIGNGRCI